MIFYIKKTEKELNERKLESFLKLSKIIQWGRRYPIKYIERFYGIVLTDYQKYVFMSSWLPRQSVWLQSRNSGKSFGIAPFVMAKANLFPNFQGYILGGGAGRQAQETFMKIEKITKKEIASAIGYTDFYLGEIEKSPTNKTGFIHNPSSFQFKLYNGSKINTLNSNVDNNRGMRANLIVYDESGFSPDELFEGTKPFLTQNSNFMVGGGVDIEFKPQRPPNQAIFLSSASNKSTYFYRSYKQTAMNMIAGDKDYFVVDIDADMVINATIDGKVPSAPLLTKEFVENEIRLNRNVALREFYNEFELDGGDKQPIKRAMIEKYAETRLPDLKFNPKQKKMGKYVFAYDPARMHDNSVMVIGYLYEDDELGYKMDIVNSLTFSDYQKKNKTPLSYLEQKKIIRQLLVDYNAPQAQDYEFIECMLVDEGAGGGGVQMVDHLVEPFEIRGRKHLGIIDREHYNKDRDKSVLNLFPDAVDMVKMMSPSKYKVEMFDALVEMLNYGYLTFPEDNNGKPFLAFYNNVNVDDGIEYEDENGDVKISNTIMEVKEVNLSDFEMDALRNITLTKEELYNIYRYDGTNNNYRYDLAPDKKTGFDDRAYCMAMLGWYLREKRKHAFYKKGLEEMDICDMPMLVSSFKYNFM